MFAIVEGPNSGCKGSGNPEVDRCVTFLGACAGVAAGECVGVFAVGRCWCVGNEGLFAATRLIAVHRLLGELQGISGARRGKVQSDLQGVKFCVDSCGLPGYAISSFSTLVGDKLVGIITSRVTSRVAIPSGAVRRGGGSRARISGSSAVTAVGFGAVRGLRRTKFANFVPVTRL